MTDFKKGMLLKVVCDVPLACGTDVDDAPAPGDAPKKGDLVVFLRHIPQEVEEYWCSCYHQRSGMPLDLQICELAEIESE